MLGQKTEDPYPVNYCGTKMVIFEVTNLDGYREGYIFYDNILPKSAVKPLPLGMGI